MQLDGVKMQLRWAMMQLNKDDTITRRVEAARRGDAAAGMGAMQVDGVMMPIDG